jgi:hypothetical protein
VRALQHNVLLFQVDLVKAPLTGESGDIINPDVDRHTLSYLVKLNGRLKEAMSRKEQAQVAWRKLIKKSGSLLDSMSRDEGPDMTFRVLSLVSALLSIMIIQSEISLCIRSRDIGVISWVMHYSKSFPHFIDMFSYLTLGYMALCSYSSFMQLRILHWYKLLWNHHTDEKSLVLFSAMFSRFIFPLGYNYLCLVEGGEGGDRLLLTEFSRVMGQIDLVPLLGRSFALYIVPGSLLLVCLVVASKWHRIVFSALNIDMEGWASCREEERSSRIAEGRVLISQELEIDGPGQRIRDE